MGVCLKEKYKHGDIEEGFEIRDGGVSGMFTCVCGKRIKIEVWGLVWEREKDGTRIQKAAGWKNIRKCKCGKKWLFVAVPDVYWKDLS